MRFFEEPTNVNSKYPCGICSKNVNGNHRAVKCDLCNYWVHIKCDKIEPTHYEVLKKSEDPYFCTPCKEEIIPFQKLSNQQFFATAVKGINKDVDKYNQFSIFPSDRLKSFFKDLNDSNEPLNDDNEFPINCEYKDLDSSLSNYNKRNNFSIFHLNIASLGMYLKLY